MPDDTRSRWTRRDRLSHPDNPAGGTHEGGRSGQGCLEACSDGAAAILITIMVLELTVSQRADLRAIATLVPVFLRHVLRFVNVGIYWSSYHHLLQATKVESCRR